MNIKIKNKAVLSIFIILLFLISFIGNIILLTTNSSSEGELVSETNNTSGSEQTQFLTDGRATVTRNITFPGKVYPISRMHLTEQIGNTLYGGPVKLISLIYNQAENTTTATYSGKLSPK